MTVTSSDTATTIELVHPGIETPGAGHVARTEPIREARHARIAVVDNGKWNAGRLLEAIRDRLVADHDMASGPVIRKQHYNRDLTDEELVALQDGADVALAAIGDCGSCTSYTVRDMVNLERVRIPTVAVVTEPFSPLAASYAGVLGMDEPRVQPIEHPLYGIDDEAFAARVDAAVDAVFAALAAPGR